MWVSFRIIDCPKMSENELNSVVWNYFVKLSKDPTKTQCKKCGKCLTYSYGSTSAMKAHLLNIHKISCNRRHQSMVALSDIQGPAPKMPKTMIDFVKREKLEEIVAKLAAIDGFSIRGITRSEFIKTSISNRGYKLPKNESDVMKLIHADFKNKKAYLENKIQMEKEIGEKFSITMDEWTSTKMRRYFNINIHASDGNVYNLGLARIHGSCDAKKTEEIVRKHLLQFNISLDIDIVACTSDGAPVMVKFGRESPTEMQLCYNHGIHLGVMDAIGKDHSCDIENSSEQSDILYDNEDENDTDEFDEDDIIDSISQDTQLNRNFSKNLEFLRKCVKFFRNSTVKNNILQQYVKKEHNRELELILDCKTRWNSIEPMIERALLLKNSIHDSLKELDRSDLFTEINFSGLENLMNVLKPIKLTVEALSRSDATIITAEGAISFLFKKLEQCNNDISTIFLSSIKLRVEKRKNTNLITLAKHLHTPNQQLSKSVLNFATDMLKRLYPLPVCNEMTNTPPNQEVGCSNREDSNFTLRDELNLAIAQAVMEPDIDDNFDVLKQEFAVYKRTGNKTKNILLLYNAIKTIKPTSTESERAFSIASNFCTKIRSRLSDDSLHALVFLKYYYLKLKGS